MVLSPNTAAEIRQTSESIPLYTLHLEYSRKGTDHTCAHAMVPERCSHKVSGLHTHEGQPRGCARMRSRLLS